MADDLATVGAVLAALKRERVPFADAWAVAFPEPRPHRERVALRGALDETRRSWERAYVGAPATAGDAAAARLFVAWIERDDAEHRGEIVGVRCG